MPRERGSVAGVQWTYELEDGGAVITGWEEEEPSGYLVIPSELEGHPVTTIGVAAIWECADLTGVSIPEGVTIIGESLKLMYKKPP